MGLVGIRAIARVFGGLKGLRNQRVSSDWVWMGVAEIGFEGFRSAMVGLRGLRFGCGV